MKLATQAEHHYVQWRSQDSAFGVGLESLSLLPLPLSLPLEVGPLNTATGSGGSAVSEAPAEIDFGAFRA